MMKRSRVATGRTAVLFTVATLLGVGCSSADTSSETTGPVRGSAPETIVSPDGPDEELREEEIRSDSEVEGKEEQTREELGVEELPATEAEMNAECIARGLNAEAPYLVDGVLRILTEGRELSVEELGAKDSVTVMKITRDCGRETILTDMVEDLGDITLEEAGCLFDATYGDGATLMVMMEELAELEEAEIDLESAEYLEKAYNSYTTLMNSIGEVATECGVPESTVETLYSESTTGR